MNFTYCLNTRKQLVRYIKSFGIPDILIKSAKECLILKKDYECFYYVWNDSWLNAARYDGLLALIELLENDNVSS